MWQSNRSRSTGWHRPAVPPVRSASHPGEKTIEQPGGMCGASGCCGGPPCWRATTSPVAACLAEAGSEPAGEGWVTCSTRAALRLTGLRCFIVCSIELAKEAGVLYRQLAVNLQTRVRPAANPLTVVQVGALRRPVAGVGLVVAPACTDWPCPAGLAVGLVVDVVRVEELGLLRPVDAAGDRPEVVRLGSGKAVTERD